MTKPTTPAWHLGRVYNEIGQPAEAAKWLMQVPEAAPQYLDAQLDAGNAFWYAYLTESIRPEAERKPKEELDATAQAVAGHPADGDCQVRGAASRGDSRVDERGLASLIPAKVNYSQILNGSGDFKGALAMLAEGRLAVVAAVAAPEGTRKASRPRNQEPAIRRHRVSGRAPHVRGLAGPRQGPRNDARARKDRRDRGGGASLTKIYLDLGRELQKEVERLQAAQDPRLAEVLKSFETFLEDMSKRKEGQDFNSLIWVAETYRALGEGLQQGDSAKAEAYFGRAVTALQQLLDEEKNKPGFIPSGGVLGVKLKIVMCKRRQKDFEEAHKQLIAVLEEKSKALDVQEEAARLFEDWARGPAAISTNGRSPLKGGRPTRRTKKTGGCGAGSAWRKSSGRACSATPIRNTNRNTSMPATASPIAGSNRPLRVQKRVPQKTARRGV